MPAAPVHVVHIISGLGRAGAETALTRLIQHSNGRAVRHTVVSLTDRGVLAEPIEAAGGVVLALGMRTPVSGLSRLRLLLRHVRALNPDVLQGWMVHGNLLAWLARATVARSSRLAWNLRLSAQDIRHERLLTRALTRLAAAPSRSVDLMISNTQSGQVDHLRLGYRPRRTELIPNGFDLELFRPDPDERRRMRAALGFDEETVAFGLVGRLHPQKGHRVFIEAAGDVAHRDRRAVFLLAGKETDQSVELRWAIAATGAQHAFRLLGEQSDVAALMRALDVACVPSLYEGFPNVLGEAMASALPCIATGVSDVRAILGNAGSVVPPADARALEHAMLDMIEIGRDARQAVGRIGRERAERLYSIQAVSARYQRAYLALSPGRKPSATGASACAA